MSLPDKLVKAPLSAVKPLSNLNISKSPRPGQAKGKPVFMPAAVGPALINPKPLS